MTLTRPSLMMLSVAVVAVNVVVYASLLYLGYSLSDDIAHWIAEFVPADYRIDWAETAMQVVVLVTWAVCCVFLAIIIASVLTGPLLDQLSERTEKILTGEVHPLPLAIGPLIYEIAATIALMFRAVFTGLLLTIFLGWIPLVGQLVPFCVAALFVALNFIQPTAIRHQHLISDRMRMLKTNKALMLGFGAPASIFPFLLVPVLTPALVVGGTRLFLTMGAAGRVSTQATSSQLAMLAGDTDTPA